MLKTVSLFVATYLYSATPSSSPNFSERWVISQRQPFPRMRHSTACLLSIFSFLCMDQHQNRISASFLNFQVYFQSLQVLQVHIYIHFLIIPTRLNFFLLRLIHSYKINHFIFFNLLSILFISKPETDLRTFLAVSSNWFKRLEKFRCADQQKPPQS